jgi:hypothetical protein
MRLGVVEDNEVGIARLAAEGFSQSWSAPRLVRGDQPTWRPDWIWGQFNMAIG